MSTATATDAAPAAKGGKKKLIMILGIVGLVLAIGGGATVFVMKKKAAEAAAAEAAAEEDGEEAPAKASKAAKAKQKAEPGTPPQFVPLDMFTVNLADRDAERYAQIGMTLQIEDPKVAEQIKVYMPAIRNNILMAIADKTAAQLMDREGKDKLARQVRRETARALGYEVAEPAHDDGGAAADKGAAKADDKSTKSKKKPRDPDAGLPITAVHFSNFIIQ